MAKLDILDRYKIVVRETRNNKTIQVHECYVMHVPSTIAELLEEYSEGYSFTITRLV